MKSLRGDIFEQIASVENIVAAIHSAAKGKRHKRSVRYAEAHAEEVAARLHLSLIRRILDGNAVRMPDGKVRKGGLPIGLFTSPWFMNFILGDVDNCFKDDFGVSVEMRFMDDIPLFDTNKRRLRRAVEAATKVLARYGLKWKRTPQIHKFNRKVRICGFCVYPDGRVELRDRVYLNGRRLGARLLKKRKGGRRFTAYDAQKMTSYSARFKAFGCYRAFVEEVLHGGKLTMSDMASIISRHDRAKAKARRSDVQNN